MIGADWDHNERELEQELRRDGGAAYEAERQDVEGEPAVYEVHSARKDEGAGERPAQVSPSTSQHIDRVRRGLTALRATGSYTLWQEGEALASLDALEKELAEAREKLERYKTFAVERQRRSTRRIQNDYETIESLRQERDAFHSVICDATGTRHEKCTPEFLQGWMEDDERWNEKLESLRQERNAERTSRIAWQKDALQRVTRIAELKAENESLRATLNPGGQMFDALMEVKAERDRMREALELIARLEPETGATIIARNRIEKETP